MNRSSLGWILAVLMTAACGDEEDAPGGSSDGDSAGAGASDGSGATSGAAGGGGQSSGGAGGGSGATAPGPDPAFLPAPTGACPDFAEGAITVAPDGKPRDVQIWISEAAQRLDGPLVFYWHGAGSSPVLEPPYGIGAANVQALKDAGGILVAPFHDPAAGQLPWFQTTGDGPDDDLRVADEVLACAIEKVGVDLRRIHAIGMSAGGLNTTQMSWRRSGYLASVVTYSGGELSKPASQDPSNKFPAMIFHGGPDDVVVIGFQAISEQYRDSLVADGHFAFVCNHGMGHEIPTDAVDSVRQFFEDHPFGTDPSPYVGGLPAGFPTYCAL